MKRIHFHTKAHYYLALIIAFCIPLGRITPVFIVLFLLNWLIEGDFKNKFQTIFQNKLSLLFIAFFLMHVIGLAYTVNRDAGLFDLQVKLSLFVFPFIFASRPLSKMQIRNLFWAFIAGGLVCSLIMLSRATYTYFAFSENNFFYQSFSFFIHPSYLSMYFNLCIAWLLLSRAKKSDTYNRFATILSFLFVLFFSFIIILLSSKMGLIIMVLLYTGFILYYIISRKKYAFGIIGLVLFVGLVYSMVRFVPEIKVRVNNALTAMSSNSSNQSEAESTAVRMLIWSASNQIISEHLLLGVGTGDSKDVLMKEYEKRGMTGALEHKLNAHNEYYQVFISVGLIGFVLLILSLLSPLYKAFTSKNAIYILFLLIIILNFIPESMFETQAGVVFYAFFNSLLCFDNNKSLV